MYSVTASDSLAPFQGAVVQVPQVKIDGHPAQARGERAGLAPRRETHPATWLGRGCELLRPSRAAYGELGQMSHDRPAAELAGGAPDTPDGGALGPDGLLDGAPRGRRDGGRDPW